MIFSRFWEALRRPDRLLFLSAMGVIVGIISGFVAQGLLATISLLSNLFFFGQASWVYKVPNTSHLGGWVVLLPALGGLAVGLLIHYCSPEIKGDGIPEAMSVILTRGSRVKPRVGFFKPLSAAITVGTGGPFGAEGPIIQTGGAIGSILSQMLPCSPSERRTLLACGAAAGLAGVFKTPFAGLFMAVELLVFEFRVRSFIPLGLASAAGTLVAMAFRGSAPVFPVSADYFFHAAELPFFVLLAILCAALAWVMTRALYVAEDLFEHLEHVGKVWFPLVPALGGLLVGLVGWARPEIFGMGYGVIADVFAHNHTFGYLVSVGVAKLFTFAAALGAGASGGTFAPALMIGGSLGAAFGQAVHHVLPNASAIGIYGLIATAALFGGIYRATPTAMLFMLEVTGAYRAMFPLFLVCLLTDLIVHHMMETTINTERLARRGISVPDAYIPDTSKLLRVQDVMTTQPLCVHPDDPLPHLLQQAASHEILPVVAEDGRYLGSLHRRDLLAAEPSATAALLMHHSDFACQVDELLHDVTLRMLDHGDRTYPVLDTAGRLVGILTPFDLLKLKQWEMAQETREPRSLQPFWRRREAVPEPEEAPR